MRITTELLQNSCYYIPLTGEDSTGESSIRTIHTVHLLRCKAVVRRVAWQVKTC